MKLQSFGKAATHSHIMACTEPKVIHTFIDYATVRKTLHHPSQGIVRRIVHHMDPGHMPGTHYAAYRRRKLMRRSAVDHYGNTNRSGESFFQLNINGGPTSKIAPAAARCLQLFGFFFVILRTKTQRRCYTGNIEVKKCRTALRSESPSRRSYMSRTLILDK